MATKRFPFKTSTKVFISARITSDYVKKACNDRVRILSSGKIDEKEYHMTIHSFFLNSNHPYYKYVKRGLLEQLKWSSINTFTDDIELRSRYGKYSIYAGKKNDFFVREFGSKVDITAFRMSIYKWIQKAVGGKCVCSHTDKIGGQTFYFYSYKGTDLYAISEHYHGRGQIKFHVSLISSDEYYKKYMNVSDQCEYMVKLIHRCGKRINALSHIKVKRDMNKFTVSMDNGITREHEKRDFNI